MFQLFNLFPQGNHCSEAEAHPKKDLKDANSLMLLTALLTTVVPKHKNGAFTQTQIVLEIKLELVFVQAPKQL